MKYLVIGLGSMGKRRVRNLLALGNSSENVAGFDPREDRTDESAKYIDSLYNDFESAIREFNPDVFLISTPPNYHMYYANFAYEKGISCFIEASVVEAEKILDLYKKTIESSILMAPSCTMRFYEGPKLVKSIIEDGLIGKVLNYNYHTGQYLPDWHPWEDVSEFYVSNPDTGGCREIVPFELSWINDIFGFSKPLACVRRKLTDINADIDDIYHCILEYPDNVIGNLTVEVISRPVATRELRVLGSSGEIVFSADHDAVKYRNIDMSDWKVFNLAKGTVEELYINPEEPYINEVAAFIKGIEEKKDGKVCSYPNTLKDDYDILQTLYKLEEISEGRHDLSR